MASELENKLHLDQLDQIGFVYKNMDAALQQYEPLFGPFKLMDTGEHEYLYRGKKEKARLKLAFGRSGDVEIELIEWISGGTPHKEFIDAGKEGMQHIRFIVPNLQQKLEEASSLGWHPIWQTEFAPGLAVAYLEKEGEETLLEFFENHGLTNFNG